MYFIKGNIMIEKEIIYWEEVDSVGKVSYRVK